MLNHILNDLKSAELIDSEEEIRIKNAERNAPFSVHWELKTLLYLGVVLLNIGLGFLIYQNIDTIGHALIIALIGLLSCGCFFYAARTAAPFSTDETKSPTPYFDYAVLLGCLTFLIVEGYLQFQYNVFGTQYSLATFLPMVLFFPVAYYFDHRGVLSMAIVALGTWLGLKISPLELVNQNDFSNQPLVYSGILLGVFLAIIGFFSELKNIKKHFAFTYFNFSIHLFFICSLTALFDFNNPILFSCLIIFGLIFWIYYGQKTTSFYFLLFAVLYGYIALTYLIFSRLINHINPTLYFLYFIISSAMCIILLTKTYRDLNPLNKKIN
jgi:Predicted membrane protein (DUF2157)